MFDELNTAFSQEEILKAISQLKPIKSGGPGRIINEFFVHDKNILRLHYALYSIRYTKKVIFLKLGLKVM